MLYVGETCRRLGDRFVEHKQSVTNGKDCPVGEHFRQANHSTMDMQVTVLLQTCAGEKQRQFLEQKIIHFLGTARLFEAYLNFRPKLKELKLNESQLKDLESVFKDVEWLQCLNGLENDIAEFMESAAGLDSNDVKGEIKLILLAHNIFDKVNENNQNASALYIVMIVGMTLYNQLTKNVTVGSTIKMLLEDESNKDLIRDCEGFKCELIREAQFVCALICKVLSDHEFKVSSTVIDIGKDRGLLDELETRIKQLRDIQHIRYCEKRNTNFSKLIKFIEVYCRLSNMKYGIWLHYYALLQLSGNSLDIAKETKTIIDNKESSDRQLMEFMVYPSKRTAIIHYLGNIQTQLFPKTFFELRGMADYDLSFLLQGQYRLSSVNYKNSRLFMANFMKFMRWSYKPKANKSKFSFKKANYNCPGNYFHIHSERFPGYHVIRSVNGFWAEGEYGQLLVERGYNVWKIVPVNIDNQKPSKDSTYAMLAPADTNGIFLFAGWTGRVCVQKFTEDEFDQVLWKISKI